MQQGYLPGRPLENAKYVFTKTYYWKNIYRTSGYYKNDKGHAVFLWYILGVDGLRGKVLKWKCGMGRYEMMETNISAKMLRKCREGVQYLLVPEYVVWSEKYVYPLEKPTIKME